MSLSRPYLEDKWGALPVPPRQRNEHVVSSDDGAGEEKTQATAVSTASRRSRVVCLTAAMLSLAASLISARLLREGFARAYGPPPAVVLIMLSITWLVIATVPLYASLRANQEQLYLRRLKRMMMLGPVLVAVGRFGFGFTALQACGVVVLPTTLLLPALGHLFQDGDTAPTRRLFCYMMAYGTVILTACAPSDGLAAVRAMALSVILLGCLAPLQPTRWLDILDRADPRRLATALWWFAGLILGANAAAKMVTGSSTPGISIGGVGLAPYWLAVFPILTATGLELSHDTSRRLPIGLTLMTAEYLFLLHEGGTALMMLIGAVLVTAVLGSSGQVTIGLVGSIAGYWFLKTGWAASAASVFSQRIADRLHVWHGTSFNSQVASYLNVISMSGLIGCCGAARVSFLIPSASKDFVLGAVVAEAGLLGLGAVTVALACYLLEIARSVAIQTNGFRRAAGCAILLALCASVIVTYSPVMGWLMPTGLPLPALSRGAAVTVAACAVVVVFEWLNREEASR
jgi:cell division protein FtsW (lipid II flippase)